MQLKTAQGCRLISEILNGT